MNLKGWRNIELSELFEFKNGLNAGKESYGTGVKFINVMEVIYNTHITADKIKGSVVLQNGQLEAYLVKKGDVLFNRTSETQEEIGLASVYLDDAPVVFGGFVIRARPLNDWLDNNFKKYCFFSRDFREQVIERGQGGIRTNIGQTDLEKVKLLTPPPSEQKYIAKVLSNWDKSIETLTQLIAAKQQLKKGLMQQLLTGKKRLPGFKGKWKRVSLKNVVDNFIVPMRDKPPKLDGEIPWCRIEDFEGKYLFRSKSNQGVTKATINEMNLKVYPINTLLVSCSANLGVCAITKKELVTNQTFIGLVCSERISNEFLYYLMSFNSDNLNKLASGTTISYLSREKFENFDINISVDVTEQNAIASVLSSIDNELFLLSNKLSFYSQQKQGLMQQLLTGKKRVIV